MTARRRLPADCVDFGRLRTTTERYNGEALSWLRIGAMKYLCLAYYDEKKFDAVSEAEVHAIVIRCRAAAGAEGDR